MTSIGMDQAMVQLRAVLHEAFEGPPERWSYFTDNAPDAGWFGTLDGITAAEASRVVAGTTIAAHVHHATFALDASTAWIRREWTPRNWRESWRVQAVAEPQWQALVAELRARYDTLARAIESHAGATVEGFGGAVGAIAHAAYHLGAIRQKLGVIRKGVA